MVAACDFLDFASQKSRRGCASGMI